MKKKSQQSKTISNRRARFDYALDNSLLVGLELTGAETKALRMGHGSLQGAYVTVRGGELWLINATISGTGSVPINEGSRTRSRKLLAKKREIAQLIAAKDQGRIIVPMEVLNRGRFIKLRIATGKGQKRYDKRATLKARDEERDIAAALKSLNSKS